MKHENKTEIHIKPNSLPEKIPSLTFEKQNSVDMGEETRVSFEGSMEPSRTDLETGEQERIGYPVFLEYKTEYPTVVTEVLKEIYAEYRKSFIPLIEKNKEWDTDYQYCIDKDGTPIIYGVQMDMQPLLEGFLEKCSNNDLTKDQIKQIIKNSIFEIEGSMAMTPLLEVLFRENGEETQFKFAIRSMIESVRNVHKRPVIMLAVTKEKKEAILASEFGIENEDPQPEKIRIDSGYDNVWGPEEFENFVNNNGEKDVPLFYVRSSDPVAKLKNPELKVETLLDNDEYRKIIKAHALTLNINNPKNVNENSKINDTKEYMEKTNLGYIARSVKDIYSVDRVFIVELQNVLKELNEKEQNIKSIINNKAKEDSEFDTISNKKKRLGKIVARYTNSDISGRLDRLEKLKKEGFWEYKKYQQSIESRIESEFANEIEAIRNLKSQIDVTINSLKSGIINKDRNNLNDIESSYEQIIRIAEDLEVAVPSKSLFDKLTFSSLNLEFIKFLESKNIDSKSVESGKVKLRAKPLTDAYGCYGHLPKLKLSSPSFIETLNNEIEKRGSYILQIEMPQCIIENTATKEKFVTIDRNFIIPSLESDNSLNPVMAGGFRSMISAEDKEAKEGRIHGNVETRWAPVKL
ncbi:MAG: hypothetical protein AAGF07_01840 [Patescibacteria group bacterium]